MCGVACATELSCLIFVIISFPVYLVFIVVLIRNRHQEPLNNPFFRIVIALGFVDLITVWHYFFFIRSLVWSMFVSMHLWGGSWLLKYYMTIIMGGQRCQQLLVLATTLNRYVAITKPFHLDTIWTRSYTNRAIALCLLVSYGSHLHLPAACDIIVLPSNNGTGLVAVWPDACWKFSLGTSALLTFTLAFIFCILYALILRAAWRNATNVAAMSPAAAQKHKLARNMAVVGGVLSSLVLFHALVFGVIAASPALHEEHFALFQALVTLQISVFSMINPWLILACSNKARLAFKEFVGMH